MIVNKKKYVQLMSQYNDLATQNEVLNARIEMMKEESIEQTLKVAEMKQMITALEEKISREESVYGDANIVKLTISDDLQSVLPHVTVKSEVYEKMVQLGVISDALTVDAKPTAMQIALMSMANEALSTILEQFEAPIESVE